MTSSKSLPKRTGKNSYKFKDVSAFEMFYQLTYMSATAAAGISRSKTFSLAAESGSPAAQYFAAINTLVNELRYDYPEACRAIADKTNSEEIKSFLLRLSDAMRSGEPLPTFLAREAEVQGDNYSNTYERDLESLKKWSDAFSSIIVSVALIVIINLVSTMIYQMSVGTISGLIATAVVMGFFGAWVLSRAAPQEQMVVASALGSSQQRRTLTLSRILLPVVTVVTVALLLVGVSRSWVLVSAAAILLPLGLISYRADLVITKKDAEISSFLRSLGGMATSTGSTLREALTRIDISSFPILQEDIERLNTRLQALANPTVCWHRFGNETGSQLVRQAIGIFYEANRLGGDPERVGFLCSLFASRTAMLRAKRRTVVSTFSWLTLVMHVVVAALMVFVLEIIHNFLILMQSAIAPDQAAAVSQNLVVPLANFSPEQLQFLDAITVMMVVLLAAVSALAIIASDGGYKFKLTLYLAVLLFMSGVSFWIVPPMVARMLTV